MGNGEWGWGMGEKGRLTFTAAEAGPGGLRVVVRFVWVVESEGEEVVAVGRGGLEGLFCGYGGVYWAYWILGGGLLWTFLVVGAQSRRGN